MTLDFAAMPGLSSSGGALRPLRLLLLVDAHFGHFRAMAGLASQLRARGHEVRFVCPDPAFAARMIAAGWDSMIAPWLSQPLGAPPIVRPARASCAILRDHLAMMPGAVQALYREFPWDLALFDPFLLWAYPYLDQLGPCTALSTKPLLTPDPLVPPWTSGVRPRDTVMGRVAVGWTWLQARRRYLQYRAGCWIDEQQSGTSHRRLSALARECAGHDPGDWACRPVAIDMRYRSAGELVLHAREFDLPRQNPLEPGVAYLGPCLGPESLGQGSPPERDRQSPLIVCSIGTEMPEAQALERCRAVIAAMALLPQMRLELSAGSPALAARLLSAAGPDDPRITVVPWLDLRTALRRASVAILHGGANSAKEAIMARCPVLPLPARADQPGMAVRLEHHGLGKRARGLTPGAIAAALSAIHADRAMAGRIEAMARCFERYERDCVASVVIERLASDLQRKHRPPTA